MCVNFMRKKNALLRNKKQFKPAAETISAKQKIEVMANESTEKCDRFIDPKIKISLRIGKRAGDSLAP
jgi:hypothetical protein